MTSTKKPAVISDANVLIDYIRAAKNVLRIMATQLWELHVPQVIVDEVEELTLSEARKLGLIIYAPTVDEYTEASVLGGGLSGRDKLCICIARNNGWACLTNDVLLRKKCKAAQVPVIWGLEALILLHNRNLFSMPQAIETAWAIHNVNPHYIHKTLVKEFVVRIQKENEKL